MKQDPAPSLNGWTALRDRRIELNLDPVSQHPGEVPLGVRVAKLNRRGHTLACTRTQDGGGFTHTMEPLLTIP